MTPGSCEINWARVGDKAKDTVGSTYLLKLVDVVGTGQILWNHELWKGFQYNLDRTFFHSFEIDGFAVGLTDMASERVRRERASPGFSEQAWVRTRLVSPGLGWNSSRLVSHKSAGGCVCLAQHETSEMEVRSRALTSLVMPGL
jgi:hypothetical protein